MADHSVSISNRLNLLGPGPCSLWGTFIWGTDYWGAGSKDLPCAVVKLLENSGSLSDDYSHLVEKIVENSQASTAEMSSESLTDGAGYYYEFTYPTTDAENRNNTTYTEGAAASTSFTTVADASTSWS